jgi:ADP-ribose pyrophosphatase
MREIERIEVVEDRTAKARCDEGFLRLRRLVVRNRYRDGSTSSPYDVDLVSRRHEDAVAIVLFQLDGPRSVRVALRSGVRPPVWMRRDKGLAQPAGREHLLLTEVVAGVLETGESDERGIAARAAKECEEEAGVWLHPDAVQRLGGPLFPSPGVSDELVHFAAAEAVLDEAEAPKGDGSPMEEAGGVVLLSLPDAIRACRCGEIPDMKTEIALLRLCDAIGYSPLFDRFSHEMPDEWQPLPERVLWLLGEPDPEPGAAGGEG